MLSSIDRAVVTFLNQFVGRAPALDALLAAVSVNDLVKGNAVMAVLWMLWFSPWPACQGPARRAGLIAGLAGSIAALALTRLLSLVLPFSARPLHEPALHLVTPAGLAPTSYSDFSSFPSDHAALFVGLAVTISFASRRWGLIVLAYVLAVICLPRLYLGLHYPSDLLAGALTGAGAAIAARWLLAQQSRLAGAIAAWSYRRLPAFYALFFLVTFQVATLFHHARALGRLVIPLLLPGR